MHGFSASLVLMCLPLLAAEQRVFQQRYDHANAELNGTWSQKYFIDNTTWSGATSLGERALKENSLNSIDFPIISPFYQARSFSGAEAKVASTHITLHPTMA
jgi:hypothetical protein